MPAKFNCTKSQNELLLKANGRFSPSARKMVVSNEVPSPYRGSKIIAVTSNDELLNLYELATGNENFSSCEAIRHF